MCEGLEQEQITRKIHDTSDVMDASRLPSALTSSLVVVLTGVIHPHQPKGVRRSYKSGCGLSATAEFTPSHVSLLREPWLYSLGERTGHLGHRETADGWGREERFRFTAGQRESQLVWKTPHGHSRMLSVCLRGTNSRDSWLVRASGSCFKLWMEAWRFWWYVNPVSDRLFPAASGLFRSAEAAPSFKYWSFPYTSALSYYFGKTLFVCL